jgi:hypothetical protein
MHSTLRIAAYYLMLAVIVSVLALQYSKQAMLPRSQTPVLWLATATTLASVLVLRSGWMRDAGWKDEQARLGTIVNNFYAPRPEALTNGFTVACGVLVSLWWAAATWSVVLGGMRRNVPGRGLADFEVAAIVGAISGGFLGAVLGLAVGQVWESRHRRARLQRTTTNA